MSHTRHSARRAFVLGLLVLASSIDAAGQTAAKRFIGGQIVLEDQGSFFIGGVPKIADTMIEWVGRMSRSGRAAADGVSSPLRLNRCGNSRPWRPLSFSGPAA